MVIRTTTAEIIGRNRKEIRDEISHLEDDINEMNSIKECIGRIILTDSKCISMSKAFFLKDFTMSIFSLSRILSLRSFKPLSLKKLKPGNMKSY